MRSRLAFFILAFIGIAWLLLGGASYELGFRYGNILAIVATLGLSYAILSKKNLLNNFKFILLGLLSGILAFLGGALLGLIPVAYFTTK